MKIAPVVQSILIGSPAMSATLYSTRIFKTSAATSFSRASRNALTAALLTIFCNSLRMLPLALSNLLSDAGSYRFGSLDVRVEPLDYDCLGRCRRTNDGCIDPLLRLCCHSVSLIAVQEALRRW